MIPYGKQSIDDDDIRAVVEVLRSDWLTTGPKVPEFEKAVADFVGAKFAVAVCNGTAALHTAMFAIGIGPGDEVILPPMTFAATANCVVYQGGTPVFSDIDPDTLLIDPTLIEDKITPKTKAIIAVDYAGQPCDYDHLRKICGKHGLVLIADACHALGATNKDKLVGSLADMTVFSFHPVKHITTGEGGMIVTDRGDYCQRIIRFRNHGISTNFRQRESRQSCYYEMTDLGYNYRLTDIQCALGKSQLKKLPNFLERRNEIAHRYTDAFSKIREIKPLLSRDNVYHAWHLYVVRLDFKELGTTREKVFKELRTDGIGVNVHYIPVHLHQFYRENFATKPGMCPVAEAAYEQIMSLPIHPGMIDADADFVIDRLTACINR